MKILLYGGSFDPVHKAHVMLLKAAMAKIKPDVTHIMPAFHSPFKAAPATPFKYRMEMVKAAFKNIKGGIVFDNFEEKKKRKTFTYEAVKYLKQKYKNPEIFILVGTDCLAQMHKWKSAEYIFKNATILAGRRTGAECKERLDFKHIFLDGTFPPAASSGIRLKIILRGTVPYDLGPVKDVIEKHRLYTLNIHDWLRAHVRENRYLHSKAVAELACVLAGVYGVNREAAALAGLVHDAGKSMSNEDLIAYSRKNNIRVESFNEICRHDPHLLHSFVSEVIAEREFKIKDKDILKAVKEHTLGSVNMSLLAKILYVADTSSKDRKYKNAVIIRNMALTDLDGAMVEATKVKIIFTISRGKWVAPQGNKIWNALVDKRK
ncbi:nicotinate-nucleotide adenylyltransferase [Parelusimicrobium proximum]|uniref:nicotinate-nucleotide adenylyltransferase n=1 Tax=Parelusimicrobium proximum TaxID=3228953 RepID=UPI003D17B70F